MQSTSLKKIKIDLRDYNYKRDIVHRLLLAQMTVLEIDVLKEILHSSLSFPSHQIAEALDTTDEIIAPVLDKLSRVGLLQLNCNVVSVNKELRKFYEVQIVKFDEDFEPGMEFFQSFLSKVPIHILPAWYAVSRSCDNIISSIIEKNLYTPKIYERYLHEIELENPLLGSICKDVMNATGFKVRSQNIINKYNITHEVFEEMMLILEYSFACCIAYEKVDGRWEEIVVPFQEWKEYLLFTQSTMLAPIACASHIKLLRSDGFAFAKDIAAVLQALSSGPITLECTSPGNSYSLPVGIAEKLLAGFNASVVSHSYLRRLIERIEQLKIGIVSEGQLYSLQKAEEWLKMSIHDQAISIYRLPPMPDTLLSKFSDRDIRELERSLRGIPQNVWMPFNSFFAGMTAHIGNSEPVHLKNKGKKWRYALPTYSDDDRSFVETLLCEKLSETGQIALGLCADKLCFKITPFGRASLS